MSLKVSIQSDLATLGARPNKVLGQHFLIDEGALTALLKAADIQQGDTVLEVGPGTGVITAALAEAGADVIAVEKDPALAEFLGKKFAASQNVEIVQDDILKFNPSRYALPVTGYALLGAPPYYLTARLFRTFLETTEAKPSAIAVIIQKEVAQKIIAEPPHATMLSVSVQLYGTPAIERTIPASSFWPAPEVDSSLLVVRDIATPALDEKRFFALARAGFSARRKQLLGNIANAHFGDKQELTDAFAAAHIDPSRRAETLSVEEWRALLAALPKRDHS
ncbi:MAG: 16S rRNA (adenine(1518)-N(6)/adenine(1519)-N(6))-dimethyltransferase RsmA [Candidatus Spechtbacterales bacterium]